MPRARRPASLFLLCHDRGFVDVGRLLSGEIELVPRQQIVALSLLTGVDVALSQAELDLVLSLPSREWAEVATADEDTVSRLARAGVVVSDAKDEGLARLRSREERLAASQWNLYGVAYHLLTRWRDVDLRATLGDEVDPLADLPPLSREDVENIVARHGVPPEPFRTTDGAAATVELPLVRRDGGLYEVLIRRRTTRAFDRSRRVTLDQLAVLLYYVFGCHGTTEILPGLVTIKRTSPSGGGLHPVEAYPLVSGVDGVEPGLYHYSVRRHALEPLVLLGRREARLLATEFVCGQTYFGGAHLCVLLTARFERTFWKYRRHQKAYAAVLMDVAHLSQTFYLVCTELGLGAFVTAAINSELVDERLGLDGIVEGTLAVCGCGVPAAEGSPFDPVFEPYVPPR
jgi:putative peptide maturation dehydrogenase